MAFYVRCDQLKTRYPSWKTREAALTAAASIGECRVGLVVPSDKESPDFDETVEHWCVMKENGKPYSYLELGEARDLFRARNGEGK